MPADDEIRSALSRRGRGGVLLLLMCGGAALLTSACSMSFPITGFMADRTPTGSIDGSAGLLTKELDQEDWRRAKAALGVALDPQGNGASVAWDNPRSGARGSFVAIAPPFSKADSICRAFQAHMAPSVRTEHVFAGSACRGPDGEWALADAKEVPKAKT